MISADNLQAASRAPQGQGESKILIEKSTLYCGSHYVPPSIGYVTRCSEFLPSDGILARKEERYHLCKPPPLLEEVVDSGT